MKNYIIRLANGLTDLMKAKGLTNEKLAELSGVSPRTISNLRSGAIKDTGLNTVAAICDALNCSIDEMLDRDCCSVDESMMRRYHTLPAKEKKIAELILGDNEKE